MPPDLGAAAYARANGFRYVEEQHNADCLKHALNNLFFSTDRLQDDAFDGKRGLTLEVARLLSAERGYWDFDKIKWFVDATFGDQLRVDPQYFYDAFGPKEFVERLKHGDVVGAVLHVSCIHHARPDHYVAIALRDSGYDIIDSIPPTADRQLVSGRDIVVTGDAQRGFVVTELEGRPLERKFLASSGPSTLCYIRKEPFSPLLQAEELLQVLRDQHRRDVRGVTFITAAPTAAAAEPSQLGSASPQSAQEEDRLVADLAPTACRASGVFDNAEVNSVVDYIIGSEAVEAAGGCIIGSDKSVSDHFDVDDSEKHLAHCNLTTCVLKHGYDTNPLTSKWQVSLTSTLGRDWPTHPAVEFKMPGPGGRTIFAEIPRERYPLAKQGDSFRLVMAGATLVFSEQHLQRAPLWSAHPIP
jgi:hypothetical protein